MNGFNMIDQADLCPVCEQLPKESVEPGHKELLVFLRCPNGHPYVACGPGLLGALNNWNQYIQWHRNQDTKNMMQKVTKRTQESYCRSCEDFTPSITQLSKITGKDGLGYVLIKQECTKCHLSKSEREAA